MSFALLLRFCHSTIIFWIFLSYFFFSSVESRLYQWSFNLHIEVSQSRSVFRDFFCRESFCILLHCVLGSQISIKTHLRSWKCCFGARQFWINTLKGDVSAKDILSIQQFVFLCLLFGFGMVYMIKFAIYLVLEKFNKFYAMAIIRFVYSQRKNHRKTIIYP